jgi:inner membrane protein
VALPFLTARSVRQHVPPAAVIVSAAVFSMAPDIDTVLWGVIPYEHFFGHRGFFHSPLFLVTLSAICAALVTWFWRVPARTAALLATLWAIVAVSHPLLDAMTDGGLGVMLLYPLNEDRYFFSWQPMRVSPIGLGAIWYTASVVLPSEFPFCFAALLFGGLSYLWLRPRPDPR